MQRAIFIMAKLMTAVAMLIAADANAVNETTKKLLKIEDDHVRNSELLLKLNNAPCEFVTHSMFQGGTSDGFDLWSVQCRDGNNYAVLIMSDEDATSRVLSCDELHKALRVLAEISGTNLPPNTSGCWTKFPTRKLPTVIRGGRPQ